MTMLNNIGPMGLLFLALVIGAPLLLIVRSSRKKAKRQERIADALEQLASEQKKQ